MADDLYVLEKLVEAVDVLVTGAGHVHERVVEAATFLTRFKPEDVPSGELRRTFIEIKNATTSQPAEGDEGSNTATLRTKNDDEAGTIARRIFELYLGLDRLQRDS